MFRTFYARAAAAGSGKAHTQIVHRSKLSVAGRFSLFEDDVTSFLRESAAAATRWYRFRKTVRELGRLDDRALHDIGIHRTEIEVTAYALAEQSASARPRYL